MESVIVPSIDSSNRACQRSALLILRRVGTEASLPLLQRSLESSDRDSDVVLLLERAIEAIESGRGEPAKAPEPEVQSLVPPETVPVPGTEPLEADGEEEQREPESIPPNN